MQQSAQAPNGLQLRLYLNATQISTGGAINASLIVYNTLTRTNSITAASDWVLSSVANGPCPLADAPPMSLAVFLGYYTQTNISAAVPLPLDPPGYQSLCPPRNFASFSFEPSSSTATAIGASANSTVFHLSLTGPVSASTILTGYYSTTKSEIGPNGSSIPAFILFPSGTYTLVSGDEWGNIIFSYFEVV